ncbi:hypothetical protein EBQ93_04760 [bacterium]|nr:hypothetical protein [bacterium]
MRTIKKYVLMSICAGLISASDLFCAKSVRRKMIVPLQKKHLKSTSKAFQAHQNKNEVHPTMNITTDTHSKSIWTESIAYPMGIGLGIGIGISLTSACIAYAYKNSLQEWLTEISTKAICNNAHKFPIHVNIPQEDVPVWIKWIVASIPTLLNQRNNPEATQV